MNRSFALRAVFATSLMLPASLALAQYTGPSARPSVTTAAAAAKAADDTQVVLEGTLARRISSDTYEFRDATGSVTAEIDAEDFQGKVDGNTRVRLHGEVDRDLRSVEIDVKRIEIL